MKRLILLLMITCLLASAHPATYCATCPRDSRGRIARSARAKRAFRKTHPCPATGKITGPCPGWIVDHRKALKHGGTDTPENMTW